MSVQIVKMQEIENISSVIVENKQYFLGEHRDFRRNEFLNGFIPENSRLSMSWASLKPDEILEIHEHPTPSMIIVYAGNGKVIGDISKELEAGDIVAIPPYAKHGFIGGDNALSTISVQFEGLGLYEDVNNARVKFNDSKGYESLVAVNNQRVEKFIQHPFMSMLNDGTLEAASKKKTFEMLLKNWSTKFQDIMFLRQGGTQNEAFKSIFKEHLKEEIGHDDLINASKNTIWDPIIEACSEWFLSKMLLSDNVEKAAIVHLVLEESAHEFHERASENLESENEEYYRTHSVHDENHSQMADHLLQDLNHEQYEELKQVISQSWDMLECMFGRMHYHIAQN